jgi:hypothetical protein
VPKGWGQAASESERDQIFQMQRFPADQDLIKAVEMKIEIGFLDSV